MLKKWVIYTCILLALVTMSLLVFWRQPVNDPSETSAPVIVTQAKVISQGVHVTWLGAQSTSTTIHGYTVQRSRSGSDFTRIAQVTKESLQYLDADGRSGDRYRILAEGSQRSKPSEPITARSPKPGSNIVAASLPNSRVLGSATPSGQASTPADQANSLRFAADTAFVRLATAVADHNFTEAASYLHALQSYQRESLLLLPDLSSAEKSSLLQVCANHVASLEATLHVLPEENQMDGMLVKAGCDAMQEVTQ